jgi:glycosyltransferase involved in cell wall biosynthesis
MADGDVLLLRDRSWPDAPGVCCWRYAVQSALADAGTAVSTAVIEPVPADPPVLGPPGAGRAARLPRVVRRPVGLAYRGAKHVTTTLRDGLQAYSPAGRRAKDVARQLATALSRADLIVAESAGAAEAALAIGAPGRRLWTLVLPAERLLANAETGPAGQIARVAPEIAGFLTDSELARESVERAASTTRVRVEVFPPLAVDRLCPACADLPPADLPESAVPLGVWRELHNGQPVGPYSFVAARWAGQGADWDPSPLLDWTQDGQGVPLTIPAAEPAEPWTAGQQRVAVARMMAATLPVRTGSARPKRRVLVSGYDLKFARDLAARLDARDDLDLTLDTWPYLGHRSPDTSRLLSQADTVFAEWARPSAVWLSRHKRPGQTLIVRLHRYELDCPYPRDIDIDAVDAVVHVSPPIRGRILKELGWPGDKLVYIPNYLDVDWFDRPKLPGARFGLGFVGLEFMNKRFDLALDILAAVRREDPRFTLQVRSVMPWDNVYAWPRDAERAFVGWCLERINRDPLLRGAVHFDSPGRDMAGWYRKVGHVLSTSDIESFHLAAAEGMASRAVPVIRPWPGATEIYDGEWIRPSVEAAAAFVLASADFDTWQGRGERACAEIRRTVDPAATVAAWADLLHGDVAAAQDRFGGLS